MMGSLDMALAKAFEAAAGKKPIPVTGVELDEHGKIVPKPSRTSASTKIRQRKSKKQRPTRRIKGSQAP